MYLIIVYYIFYTSLISAFFFSRTEIPRKVIDIPIIPSESINPGIYDPEKSYINPTMDNAAAEPTLDTKVITGNNLIYFSIPKKYLVRRDNETALIP